MGPKQTQPLDVFQKNFRHFREAIFNENYQITVSVSN